MANETLVGLVDVAKLFVGTVDQKAPDGTGTRETRLYGQMADGRVVTFMEAPRGGLEPRTLPKVAEDALLAALRKRDDRRAVEQAEIDEPEKPQFDILQEDK